ncbi:MAG: adenosylcobinamide-phosphate synthase CbiB [Promethearchaeota archaeon]
MNLNIYVNYFCFVIFFTLLFSFLIDLIIGDPKSDYHPVMIIGKTIDFFKNKFRTGKPRLDKFLGIVLLFLVIIIFCIPIYLLQIFIWQVWNLWDPYGWQTPSIISLLIVSAMMGFLLKWPFALKSLGQATLPIGKALKDGDIMKARSNLSLIVRRDTQNLDQAHVISATVECIAESSTDATTSVIWFYLMGNLIGVLIFTFIQENVLWLFMGIPFAYMFRIINTADSVVGYKDEEHVNIGWFSARMDDLSNYIPSRLTVLFMLITGKIMRKDVKNAWKVLKLDRNSLESVNAGWTMGTMAGLLNIQLEKVGKYRLGIPNRALLWIDIKSSFRIILLTVLLYSLIISIMVILLINLIMIF